jgi:uncharacterized protein YyaL (SSP411 family)
MKYKLIFLSCFFILSCSFKSISLEYKPALGTQVTEKAFGQWQQAAQKKLLLLPQEYKKKEIKNVNYLNQLVLENSPYLLRHATNPIAWQPWSAQIFKQAKQQNKMIFLSIGYSTCHWCHVMEVESFTDVKVAKLLSTDYIAVKVDRELLPNVDEHYKILLEALTGSAGWPITAVLNPDAEPLFISSYLNNKKLSALLTKLPPLWQINAAGLNANAKSLVALAEQSFSIQQSLNWQPDILNKQVSNILSELDPQYGGIKALQKFPNESLLLLLLEYLAVNKAEKLEALVKLQLDNMIENGLYDHLNGGFHRYAIDPQWSVPHYEKMLYNQGQMLLVYSKAYQLFGDEKYKKLLIELTVFIKQWFYQKGKGFSSAIDAVYQDQEGGYYVWPTGFLAQYLSTDELALINIITVNDKLQSFNFNQLFISNNQSVIKKLKQFKASSPKPFIDQKIISSWNGLSIEGLLTAYQYTGQQAAKEMAENALTSIIANHYNPSKNTLVKNSYLGKSGNEGQLDDYVFIAKAALKMFDITNEQKWLNIASQLMKILVGQFEFKTGLYSQQDQRAKSSISALSQPILQDSEIISAHGALLNVFEKLWRRTGEVKWREYRDKTTHAFQQYLMNSGSNGVLNKYTLIKTLLRLKNGSTEPVQYFARGQGKAQQMRSDNICQMPKVLRVTIQPGWHINSEQPLQPNLLPTKLTLLDVTNTALPKQQVQYPEPLLKQLKFDAKPLSLFEGVFDLSLTTEKNNRGLMQLSTQACSDSICLFPEKLQFSLHKCF